MGKVAICVPCWNQVQYTKWFVESVQRNSPGMDVHFILLDNGSIDDTWNYINSLPISTASVISFQRNEGVNRAWNKLLVEGCKYRYWRDGSHTPPDVICLANNDIIVGPDWLEAPVRELAKNDQKSYFVANGSFNCDQLTFNDAVRAALPGLRGQRCPGRGGWCLFFTPAMVNLFWPIPKELILWFGDDWIHHKLGQAGYKCETLLDCCALHFLSKSVTEYPNKIERIALDRAAFERIMEEEKTK